MSFAGSDLSPLLKWETHLLLSSYAEASQSSKVTSERSLAVWGQALHGESVELWASIGLGQMLCVGLVI